MGEIGIGDQREMRMFGCRRFRPGSRTILVSADSDHERNAQIARPLETRAMVLEDRSLIGR